MEQITKDNVIFLIKGAFIIKLGEIIVNEEKKIEELKSSTKTKETKDTNDNDEDNLEASKKEQDIYENLNIIFTIMKNIFNIADQQTIELLMSDELYLIVFNALECTTKL